MTNKVSMEQLLKEPLRFVSESLCDFFEREDVPSEEHMRRFLREVANDICHGDASVGQVEDLGWLAETFYNYSDFDAKEERVFDLGACWAAVLILRDAEEVLAEQGNLEEMQKMIDANAELFALVGANPGIGHAELAHKLGNSPSRQSQIMSSLVGHGLISSVKRGRNKNYYIGEKAESLLDLGAANVHERLHLLDSELMLIDETDGGTFTTDGVNDETINVLYGKGNIEKVNALFGVDASRADEGLFENEDASEVTYGHYESKYPYGLAA